MRLDWQSPRLQIAALAVLAVVTAMVGLADGDFSLRSADRAGYSAFVRQDYAAAAERFVDPQWRAAALYRAGAFERAASLLAGYDTAEAAFNQGNALVLQGQYSAAAERYRRALQLRPGWADAEANRAIALARAAALKREGGDISGGMMGADDFVFEQGGSKSGGPQEQTGGGPGLDDAAQRSIWLRQVQTRPADFLRAKFAYQYRTQHQEVAE